MHSEFENHNKLQEFQYFLEAVFEAYGSKFIVKCRQGNGFWLHKMFDNDDSIFKAAPAQSAQPSRKCFCCTVVATL